MVSETAVWAIFFLPLVSMLVIPFLPRSAARYSGHVAALCDGALLDSRVLMAHRLGADERGAGEALQVVPLGAGGEPFLIADRERDKAGVGECALHFLGRLIEKLRRTRGAEREAFLQIDQRLDRVGT